MNDILKQLATVDVAGLVFDEVLTSLPDDNEELRKILKCVQAALPAQLYMDLEAAVNSHVITALEKGFRAGWHMRSRA